MSEPSGTAPASAVHAAGAGAMLRAARESQGLSIDSVAASMKVPQAKLEALEAERYQDLPDVAFTRALSLSMCRMLKIDPSPVLAKLPFADPLALERVDGGLNMPFRDRPGRIDPVDWGVWRHPVFWIVAVLLAGAAALAYVPSGWLQDATRSVDGVRERLTGVDSSVSTSIPAILPASALAGGIVERVGNPVASVPAEPQSSPLTTSASAPASAASAAPPVEASASAVAVTNATTRIRAIESTWVQVTDSRGQVLLSRLLSAGEAVGFDAEPPLKIRIGNARGTELMQRGQRVDLAAATRDNIANVDLR